MTKFLSKDGKFYMREGKLLHPANILEVPIVTSNFTYNGKAQSPTIYGYDENTMTMGGVTSGTDIGTYQITFTPKSGYEWSDGSTTTKTITWKIIAPPIYGVDFTNMATTSKCTRTDDAADFADPQPAVAGGTGSSPFDNIMPWSGMVRSTDPNAGEVVAIPKFYFKWETDGTKATGLKISMTKLDGFNTSPAHMDRGDGKGERDVIYVGRYHSCSTNKSTTGQMPKVNITRSNARTAAHSLGSNIWQFDYATRVTIWMLYLVEFADWNSQAKIGYGCGNNSSTENVGASDNMQYHTGTMQVSRATYGVGVQYRNIEGLWDNVFDWMDGCYLYNLRIFIILNPSNFSDTENGTAISTRAFYDNNYIGNFAVSDWAIYPDSTAGGSSSTGSCDSWYHYSNSPCLWCGGFYNNIEQFGLFYVTCRESNTINAGVGFRVIILP